MKKRLLAMLLALVLVFSLLPSVVIAEGEEHVHCLCGADKTKGTVCAECGSEAVVWDATSSMPNTTGHYYLSGPVTAEKVIINNSQNVAVCLHGNTITSTTGNKIAYIAGGATLTITDCAEVQGSLTGCTKDNTLHVANKSTLNLYGGKITGNNAPTIEGTIKLDQGTATVNSATFNMYGGEISGNTVKRGTIYTTMTNVNHKPHTVRILGGTITGNHAVGTSKTAGGGAGILSMFPVEVGGNAKIYDNTAVAGPADVYLRNDQKAGLVLSTDKPLTSGARIVYGLYNNEADTTDLKAITGAPGEWKNIWVSYDGQKVGYADGKFFVDNGPADSEEPGGSEDTEKHVHCLCGVEKTEGTTCSKCGSEAVEWTETSTMPTASGYYYLSGPVSAAAQFLNNGENISLCLHGQTVTSAAGKKFLYLNKNNTYNITDCTAETVDGEYIAGGFTGVTGVDTYGSTMRINAGSVLNLYNGKIFGNKANDSGIVYVDASGNAAVAGGTFNMYGGEISGNTCQRGTVYGVSTGTNKPVIRILGGTITGNKALGTGEQVGGGGIYAFTPVEVGGDAKIFGNEATFGAADIYLQNSDSYTGALVISADVPLKEGAQIAYGLNVPEANPLDLKFISGTPSEWNNAWVSLDGDAVSYIDGKFCVLANGHFHCLCGKNTTLGQTCADCGSEVVAWGKTDTLPTASGYYYLTGDVTTGAVIPAANAEVHLCLHSQNITSAAGKKIWYVANGASMTVTDCAETKGSITGCTADCTVQVATGSVFNLYNGKITGNTNDGEGIMILVKGNATTDGGTFNMYGGEISGNTCKRGTIMMNNTAKAEEKLPVVRILGGTITGNHATGTTAATCGGAAIMGMGPVEIGGDAKIYGNTAEMGPADIYIRNDQKGVLVVSADVPLKEGAQINYGLHAPEANPLELKFITGTPENWDTAWVSLDGEAVSYVDGKFCLLANGHFHCLCGKNTTLGQTCADCGSEVVAWSKTDALPKNSGYFYLASDVTTGAVVPDDNAEVFICLHGHDIASAAGKKIWYVTNSASVTVTDCAETQGSITGCKNEPVVQVTAGAAFQLYGGKITGNTTTGEGVILLGKGDTTTVGGTFNMYGGEISGNTCKRGTIMMTNAPGEDKSAVVRILGGTITGNHATGTTKTTGGGAGIVAMGPVEVGGDAKIYGNTAESGPADIYVRNDQKGTLVISSEKPLTAGAKITAGVYTKEKDPADLQYVTGTPAVWDPAWITYCGEALRYKEKKFTIAKDIVWSSHKHDDIQWISVTEETGWLPETTGHYVLDADVQLPAELKILPQQKVVLCLNGHTLTAAPGVRHFYVVSGGELTICDCTAKTDKDGKYTAGKLTGADNTVFGGSIRIAPAGVVNFHDGKVTGNHTTGEGGAFYLEACNLSNPNPAVLNMYGGEISENTADKGFGAAIRLAGAPDDLLAATFHMEGGFIRNHRSPNYGGAIHAPGKATIELMGGVIENNEAVAGGGAVSVNGASTVILDGTIIRNNAAEKWGGGLYIKTGATMKMRSGEVSGNSSKIGAGILLESEGTNLTVSGGKITKNAAGTAGGGGVYVGVKCQMTMDGGEVCENTSKAGGAGISVITSELIMNGGSICHNQAATWGAGLLVSTDAKVTMNGGSINGNYTPKSAAGIYAWCSEVVINKGSISDNVAQDSVGGIRLTGSKLTMNGGSVSGNMGNTNSGAGIMGEQASRKIDGVKNSVPSHIVMYGGSVSYNKTAKAGSGVIIQSKGSTFEMYGGTISHNHAGKFAGAVYVGKGAAFNMHGGEVCYNTMETDGTAGVYHDGSGSHTGGAIHHNSSPKSGAGFAVSGEGNVVHAKGLKIYANTAKVAGGVLVQSRGTLHMENCEIYDNTATLYGGGVYMYTYTTTTMKNCKVYNNKAQADGGGLWMWATAHLIMDDCQIYNNKAIENEGGGIWTRGDTLTMRNCEIRDNQAAGNGGGICAGMMGSATRGEVVEYIRTENTIIENNTSGKQGGAIYLSVGSKARLYDTQLVNNTAAAEGGALWAKEDLTMHAVTATGNTSGGEGYAIYLADSDYDGHSYFAGVMKMSGDMQIVDNHGGDLYLGKQVPVILDGEGLGQNAKIHVNLHSGLLTQWVWGTYNYEGGNCDYIITYGERSVNEPEYAAPETENPETEPSEEATETPTEGEQEAPKSNIGLIAGIGAVVAVVAAAAIVIVLAATKKKKVTK